MIAIHDEQTVYDKFYQKKTPLAAGIWLTTKCNSNCILCFRHKNKKQELTTNQLKNIITQLAQAGCMQLMFTGGEPFCREDFFDIMNFARRNNFGIIINTNGTKITKANIKEIKEIKPLEIYITLYGATKEMHESITRIKGSFEKTLRGINLLEKNRIPFCIQTSVTKNSFSGLKGLYDICKKKWEFLVNYIIYPFPGCPEDYLNLRVTDNQFKYAVKNNFLYPDGNLVTLIEKRKKSTLADRLALSYIGIVATGKVFASPLLRLEVGDLRKDSLHNILHSPKLNRLRNLKLSDFECSTCKHCFSCGWEPGLALLEHGDLTVSPKEWCRIHKWELKEMNAL